METAATLDNPLQGESEATLETPVQSGPEVTDYWRRWIAECLLLDYTPDAIAITMRRYQFNEQAIWAEIQNAIDSPYLQGCNRIKNRSLKYEWFFKTRSTVGALSNRKHLIERRAKLDEETFFEEYYFQNKPVIITGMIDDWPAMQRWNLDYLRTRFGDMQIEIQFGRNSETNFEENYQKYVKLIKLSEYIELIEQSGPTNDFYLTNRNAYQSETWTLMEKLRPDTLPLPYLSNIEDSVIWLGPEGTLTPLHHDPVNLFMVQILGRKQVLMAPPYDVVHLYHDRLYYSQYDPVAQDHTAFPKAANASFAECILHPGEILFLPIGWWHHVRSLDVAITFGCRNFKRGNKFDAVPKGYL